MMLSEIVIDKKFNPMNVSPRNNPVIPVMPKLRATLNTVSSMMSILSFFLNLKSMLTRQFPGMKNTKMMDNATRRYPSAESAGIQ